MPTPETSQFPKPRNAGKARKPAGNPRTRMNPSASATTYKPAPHMIRRTPRRSLAEALSSNGRFSRRFGVQQNPVHLREQEGTVAARSAVVFPLAALDSAKPAAEQPAASA